MRVIDSTDALRGVRGKLEPAPELLLMFRCPLSYTATATLTITGPIDAEDYQLVCDWLECVKRALSKAVRPDENIDRGLEIVPPVWRPS